MQNENDNLFPAFGALDEAADPRNIPAAAVIDSTQALPDIYIPDYLGKFDMPNQKRIGSCGGHMLTKYRKIQEYRVNGQVADLSYRWPYAFAWNRNKALNGYSGEGSRLSDLFYVAANIGFGLASDFPNNSDLTHAQYVDISGITQEMKDRAALRKAEGYAFVNWNNEDEIKRGIIQTGGVALSLLVGKEWWTPSWDKKYTEPVQPPAQTVSGHFIVLDSYGKLPDGQTQYSGTFYQFPNSWSDQWADVGRSNFIFQQYQPFITGAGIMTAIPNSWLDLVKRLPNVNNFSHQFDPGKPLKAGDTGPEVEALQTFLILHGWLDLDPSIPLGYFGHLTQTAIIRFQKQYASETYLAAGLTAPSGIAGAYTLRKINSLIGQ